MQLLPYIIDHHHHHHLLLLLLPAPSQTILGSAVRVPLGPQISIFSILLLQSLQFNVRSYTIHPSLSWSTSPSMSLYFSSPMPSLLIHLLPSLAYVRTISSMPLSSYQQCLSLHISSVFPRS